MNKKTAILLGALVTVLSTQEAYAKSIKSTVKETVENDLVYKAGRKLAKFLKRRFEKPAGKEDFEYMTSLDKQLTDQKELLLNEKVLAGLEKQKVATALTAIASKVDALEVRSIAGDHAAKMAYQSLKPSVISAIEHQNLLDALLGVLEEQRGNFALVANVAIEHIKRQKSAKRTKEDVQENVQKLYDVYAKYAQQYIIVLTRIKDSAAALQEYIEAANMQLKDISAIKTASDVGPVQKKLAAAIKTANGAKAYAQRALDNYPKEVEGQTSKIKDLNAFLTKN